MAAALTFNEILQQMLERSDSEPQPHEPHSNLSISLKTRSAEPMLPKPQYLEIEPHPPTPPISIIHRYRKNIQKPQPSKHNNLSLAPKAPFLDTPTSLKKIERAIDWENKHLELWVEGEIFRRLGNPLPNPLTLSQLKKGYRSLAKKYHPDHGSGNAEKFKSLHLAYQALKQAIIQHEDLEHD